MAAIVHKLSTNVAPMESHQLKVQTFKGVHVLQANSAVVQMVSLMHRVRSSMDVMAFHRVNHKLQQNMHVAWKKTVVLAQITRPNISLTWNTVVVHTFGTVAVEAIKIASIQLMTAQIHANTQKGKMFANCRRFADHAAESSRIITTI